MLLTRNVQYNKEEKAFSCTSYERTVTFWMPFSMYFFIYQNFVNAGLRLSSWPGRWQRMALIAMSSTSTTGEPSIRKTFIPGKMNSSRSFYLQNSVASRYFMFFNYNILVVHYSATVYDLCTMQYCTLYCAMFISCKGLWQHKWVCIQIMIPYAFPLPMVLSLSMQVVGCIIIGKGLRKKDLKKCSPQK